VVTVAVAGWALALAIRGRRLAWQPGETTVAVVAVAMTGLMVGEWAVRLLVR
jgi:hypothetical protein